MLRQRGDNLIAIGRAFASENFRVNLLANPPIEESQGDIDGDRGLAARFRDQRSDRAQKVFWLTT